MFSTASAWKCTGHMLVALIAELSLISQDPKAYSEASLITSFINNNITSSSAQTFVESACWADDLKTQNITLYNPYHYFDMPYFPSTHFNITLPSENILSAWNTIKPYLKSTSFDLDPLKSSIFLRFLQIFVLKCRKMGFAVIFATSGWRHSSAHALYQPIF